MFFRRWREELNEIREGKAFEVQTKPILDTTLNFSKISYDEESLRENLPQYYDALESTPNILYSYAKSHLSFSIDGI